jgi:TPR repeat protein
MRPANVVSPEPTSRVPVNPPPEAALVPSQPIAEAGGAVSKPDSSPAEAAVPRFAAPAGGTGESNRVSAELVPETNVRGALPTTVETAALLSRGDALFETRDIASARLFYEYAANSGDAQAAIRLGETFDPAFLSRLQVKGVRGEPAVALKWYKRAQELGARDAEVLIVGLQRN